MINLAIEVEKRLQNHQIWSGGGSSGLPWPTWGVQQGQDHVAFAPPTHTIVPSTSFQGLLHPRGGSTPSLGPSGIPWRTRSLAAGGKSLTAGIIPPMKKKVKSLWPCIDYRSLNNITMKSRYPLPLVSSAVFKKLDLRDAIWSNQCSSSLPGPGEGHAMGHASQLRLRVHWRHPDLLQLPGGPCAACLGGAASPDRTLVHQGGKVRVPFVVLPLPGVPDLTATCIVSVVLNQPAPDSRKQHIAPVSYPEL